MTTTTTAATILIITTLATLGAATTQKLTLRRNSMTSEGVPQIMCVDEETSFILSPCHIYRAICYVDASADEIQQPCRLFASKSLKLINQKLFCATPATIDATCYLRVTTTGSSDHIIIARPAGAMDFLRVIAENSLVIGLLWLCCCASTRGAIINHGNGDIN